MTTARADLDAVKAAVSSTSTCTAATVVALKELLALEETTTPKTKSRTTTATSTSTSQRNASSSRSKPQAEAASKPALGSKERTALATHVINVTVKSLSEAAKPVQPMTPAKRVSQDDLTRTPSSRRTLRRSNSTPLSPIPQRTLNRVATSPIVTTKAGAKAAQQTQATRCLSTVECARVAFASLRAAKGPIKPDQTDFQLEQGIAVLVGKLTGLGLHDQAVKELRILHKRLDIHAPAEPKTDAKTGERFTVPELLRYHGTLTTASLSVITSCQLQVLRWAASTKKPSHVEGMLEYLRESNTNSPANLLERLAKENPKEASKAARSMAVLSQTLLSMAPSLSSSEDAVALEPRLSVTPEVAFELQALAFRTQLRWWPIAGHKGKLDDEILSPFSRCVVVLTRRLRDSSASVYDVILSAHDQLQDIIRNQDRHPSLESKSPSALIYNLLGSTAQASRRYDDAYEWYQKMQSLSWDDESSVGSCSLSARTLAVALKRAALDSEIEAMVSKVIKSLEGGLSGTATELNELFESLSVCRRSVVGLLMSNWTPGTSESTIPDKLKGLLKLFIAKYIRFVRRWLGSPPKKDASAKHMLQFDQRRQLLTPLMGQILDATLAVAKADLDVARSETWSAVDEVLQECLVLIDAVRDPAARTDQLATYTVKLSNLYFSKFVQLRKEKEKTKETNKILLHSLNRSIDAVKDRSPSEKEKAQLSTKLELLAELCKRGGRSEDAINNLRSICTHMVEAGVLSSVANLLASQSPVVAWTSDEKASSLSRTLRSIAKLDKSWNDWTFFLPELDRAAVVEHLLHITRKGAASGEPLKLHDPAMAALLRLHSLDRFPIRRLRTLLFLYSQTLDNVEEVENITSQIEQCLDHIRQGDLGDDVKLTQFSEHFQAYYGTLSTMADLSSFPSQGCRGGLATWKTLLNRCQSRDELLNVVDDPESLLEHLKSLSELCNLKGEAQLQLSISELNISLSKLWEGSGADRLVAHQSLLATQYIGIGLYAQAATTLKETEDIVAQNPEVSARVLAEFHLSQAEYFAGIGRSDEAASHLIKVDGFCGVTSSNADSKLHGALRQPLSYYVQSIVALQSGDIAQALSSIKAGIRLLTHDWSRIEGASRSNPDNSEMSLISKSSNDSGDASKGLEYMGPRFWVLAPSFLRSLLQISAVYAHIGMYKETLYYAEYAGRIAEGTNSSLYRAQVATWTGTVYSKACQLEKAADMLVQAKQFIPDDVCAARVRLARELAGFYRELGEEQESIEYYRMAEETAQKLNDMQRTGNVPEKQGTAVKLVVRSAAPAPRPARGTRAAGKATTVAPARAPRRVAASKTKTVSPAVTPASEDSNDLYRSSLTASIALSRALGFIQRRDWDSALTTLATVRDLPKLMGTLSQEQIITATSLIGQSMDLMIKDPVFSVMQDSTISFPATSAASAKAAMERSSPGTSPPPKGRATAVARKGSKEASSVPTFANSLAKAHELLSEAHSTGLAASDSAMVHRISALLQSTVIMLSATSATRAMTGSSPAFATVAAELARNVVWKREVMTLKASSTPMPYKKAAAPRRSSLGLVSDMSRLQMNYIEMVPKNWSIISMSLSDNRHDLYITKFQAGHSPFVLRLPLERANSRDVDSGIFNFEHGQEELLDIIKNANRTSHSAREFTTKTERNAWWEEREELDGRLKDLLEMIESTWLGGFKGIFSQHHRRPDLLARFQKSFQKILDGCLPSRNNRMAQGKKPAKSQGVTLDPRILDLFIGLGDPSEPTNDFDEALNDLLYFVVDILQFHGERNAYDEIDFDAMVVETYDALRGYYAALGRGFGREDGAHTVLVLDKALHAFPWESMPCMDGLAVSRVPSLSCLRRLLTEAKKPASEDFAPGHYVSATGTYMLNPSSDLKNTQRFFQSTFDTHLSSWTKHVSQIPTESDFETALSSSDIFLYFGHGSGAQYVRSSRIRALEKCRPATFLMGCSSAALSTAGAFECHGPVWNHLMAGCPAVVGTLWDVTDRDIDRFAGRAFEEWGLFEKGTFKDDDKKKGKKTIKVSAVAGEAASLTEAVAKAREVCRFRYLNAAAVVQYGIPVYISREGE